MLSEDQIKSVWEGRIAAEVRSLYFGDLASFYSTQKQWITGLTFFLSSSAAATLIGKLPVWFPTLLSVLVALITAYAVAVNLDTKIRTMAKLHYSWKQLLSDYEKLWNHHFEDEAETELSDLSRRELELSEFATTDAPNDPERMGRWQDQVLRLHGLPTA
jgi:hypothetical protein